MNRVHFQQVVASGYITPAISVFWKIRIYISANEPRYNCSNIFLKTQKPNKLCMFKNGIVIRDKLASKATLTIH